MTQRPSTDRALLRAEEVAEILGISRWNAQDLIREGRVPSVMVGKRRRVPVAALHAWVAQQAERSLREPGATPEADEGTHA